MKTIAVKNISELSDAAKEILNFAKEKHYSAIKKAGGIFCFYGELGSGKTTLIKSICKQLGAADSCSSPTFALVNEYKIPSPSPATIISGEKRTQVIHPPADGDSGWDVCSVIYHLDLYRLKNESEIYDIGCEEYLVSGNYCFIEWAEKMEHLLPDDCIKIRIEVKEKERFISIS